MKRQVFTLIELLVVVAIIGILASILMPSLQSARGKAKTAVCLSQMKQLGLSYTMYTDDNKDVFMEREFEIGRFWHARLYEYHNDKKAIHCSSAEHPDRSGTYKGNTSKEGWGGDGSWGWVPYADGSKVTGSIGLNGFLYTNSYYNPAIHWQTIGDVENTNNTPVFTDNAWVDTWPRDTQSNPTDMNGSSWGMLNRVYINRHWGKNINSVQIDNSAKTVKISNILYLDWSKTINYRSIPLL